MATEKNSNSIWTAKFYHQTSENEVLRWLGGRARSIFIFILWKREKSLDAEKLSEETNNILVYLKLWLSAPQLRALFAHTERVYCLDENIFY